MTNVNNPNLMQTNRRDVLRGSILFGATAMTGLVATGAWAGAGAAKRPMPAPSLRGASPRFLRAQAEAQAAAAPVDLSRYERVRQNLVAPPFAPAHQEVATTPPRIVVDEETEASIRALTCNGSVPGLLIIVHQADYVELTLRNPAESRIEHNINFHASTGALGCGLGCGLGGGLLAGEHTGQVTAPHVIGT